MSDKSNILKIILEWIIRLLGSSNKTQNSSESANSNSGWYSNSDTTIKAKAIKRELTEVAKKVIEEEAVNLGMNYVSMLRRLNPKQKEFVLKMAEIKALKVSELTFEETLIVGDLVNEAAKLNLEITKELNEFWNKFGAVVSKIGTQFAKIGIRTITRTLTAGILG